MKKIISLIFAALLVVCGLAVSDFAQTKSRPYSINHRQQRQQKRIIQGIKSDELTARETYRLTREQYQIRRMKNRFRRSGDGLSWREKYKLQRELNQASRHIYKQKHDKQNYQYPKKRL
jgi:allophanate hydrolase subunit 2